jgi:uncharacterized protein YdeI (YjbR/CyaY-like superfamily)
MATKDPRIDAYIETSNDFARPILKKLRALVHKGCPGVVETIKWGMPAFEYKGPFCGMAAFKKHCVFGFWKAELLFRDQGKTAAARTREKLSWGAKGSEPASAHLTDVKDLPSDAVILKLIKEAVALNDEGVKLSPSRTRRKPLPMPEDFEVALRKAKGAGAAFEAFSLSQKREYIEWITEAKREETRRSRIATAVEWIAEGKTRNWKYQKR